MKIFILLSGALTWFGPALFIYYMIHSREAASWWMIVGWLPALTVMTHLDE